MGRSIIDITAHVIGRLTVLAISSRRANRSCRFWLCACNCGNFTTVKGSELRGQGTRSCGCLAVERATTHGDSGKNRSPEYRAWAKIKTRCYNAKQSHWPYYGGRGIQVCERWRGQNGFENFLTDMGRRPSDKHSIERDDVNGNYESDNCRWATKKEQAGNRRNTLYVVVDGKKIPLKSACVEAGVNYYSARARLKKGQNPFVRVSV